MGGGRERKGGEVIPLLPERDVTDMWALGLRHADRDRCAIHGIKTSERGSGL